jgi:hypothetical protein
LADTLQYRTLFYSEAVKADLDYDCSIINSEIKLKATPHKDCCADAQ